jgi:osmoprotectant transport system substrate-binding protein
MDRTKTVALLGALLLAGCSRGPRIVVGSKNFTEQLLLGEILAQHLEKKLGVPVERRLNLGGTLLAHEALVAGSIDLYPEYTGTALTAVLKRASSGNSASVLDAVRLAYREKWRLEWLAPLGFNDTFAMIVRGETARREKLTTISSAAAAHAWNLGVGYEFEQRPDGLGGLMKTYGLRTAAPPVTMDLGLLYQALGSGRVDLIAANSTDGLAAAMDVTILEDDRHYFPPYECAVVVRAETLRRFPALRGALEELGGKFSDARMRKLNFEVDGKHRSPADVARSVLSQGISGS